VSLCTCLRSTSTSFPCKTGEGTTQSRWKAILAAKSGMVLCYHMLPQRMMMAAGNPANRPAPQPSYPTYLPYGYFGAGRLGSPSLSRVSTVDRIDYANDTVTASVRGPLSSARYKLGATSTSAFGYFGGGSFPVVSTIDRIDYANDTVTADPRGPLSQALDHMGGAQNCPL